jgi:hypothetical protein
MNIIHFTNKLCHSRSRFVRSVRVHAVDEQDRAYMRQALMLAKRGLGKTYPNPAVGCVIVRDGQVGRFVTGNLYSILPTAILKQLV